MWKQVKNFFIFWALRPWILFFSVLPLGLSRSILEDLGKAACFFDRRGRERAGANLALAFPGRTPEEIKAIVRAMYAHFGICAAELIKFPSLTARELEAMASVEGLEHLTRAYQKGKGVLCVTGHVGNWELLAAVVAKKFPVKVVGRDVYDPRLNALLERFRRSQGYGTFSRQGSVKPILGALHQGNLLGILCDQDTGVKSIFVDFFGRPAATPSGPVMLSQHTGAPIIPAVIVREKGRHYTVKIGPEIPVPGSGTGEEKTLAVVRAYTAFLEKHIREHPEQWVWFHERWKTRP